MAEKSTDLTVGCDYVADEHEQFRKNCQIRKHLKKLTFVIVSGSHRLIGAIISTVGCRRSLFDREENVAGWILVAMIHFGRACRSIGAVGGPRSSRLKKRKEDRSPRFCR